MRLLSPPIVLLVVALIVSAAAPAARAQTGVLGIDCDRPRPNDWGLLVAADEFQIARCEADRAKALNWSNVVMESAARLRRALSSLPPPLQDSLYTHMTTSDDLDTWTWSDTAVETLLTSLAARDPYRFTPALEAAQHYSVGIVAGSTLNSVWHDDVQARFCGDLARRRGHILVWMDESTISGNDRWNPEMVRRVKRDANRVARGGEMLGKVENRAAPAATPDLVYVGANARETALSDPCWAGVDTGTDGVIAYMFTAPADGWRPYHGRQACPIASNVGYRLVRAEERNGVFVRPEGTQDDPAGVAAGVTRAPGAGGIIPAINHEEAWQLYEDHCRAAQFYTSRRTVPCSDAGSDGVEIHAFFYLEVRADDPKWPVPGTAVRVIPVQIDDSPATTVHQGMRVSSNCTNPTEPLWDLTPEEVTCTSLYGNRWCPDEHGTSAPYGLRRCWLREIQEGYAGPTFDVQVRSVTDHCFDLVSRRDSESRTGSACEVVATTTPTTTGSTSYLLTSHHDEEVPDPDWVEPSPCADPEDPDNPNHADCGTTAPLVTVTVATTTTQTHTETGTDQGPCDCPPGWSGSITQERDFRWHDRDWALDVTNPSGAFSLSSIASWWDAASPHAPGEARVYAPMRSALEGRQSNWKEPGMTDRDFPAAVYTVWLEQDWHEETNNCTPPPPSVSESSPTSWLGPDGKTYTDWSPETERQVDRSAEVTGRYRDSDDD